MFYVNNEEIKGLYIGDRPYNYIVSGFSKIIPEDRNVDVLNLNLAWAFLNSYRVEYGNIEGGYTNAPIKRIDKPDYDSVYHTPFTYFDGNNIVPTKNIPIVITNGFYAFTQGNVYNDININGNYSRLAYNVDFQGKTVRTNSESSEYERYLRDNVFEGCSNFTAELKSKYSTGYSVLCNCNNFTGNYKFEGNSDAQYPGFPGFLMECKDGKFNIDATNLRGGGSDTNVYDRLDFECMRYCDNVDLNITGSGWQSWPQMHAFSYNCNINTFNIIPGFGGLDNSNINATLPKDSTPEIVSTYEFLKDSNGVNYKLIANDCNLFNFYSGVGGSYMFLNLNNCNLNLLLNNSVVMDRTFGNHINKSNIEFYNAGLDASSSVGWDDLHNCNIQGSIVKSDYNDRGFIEGSNNLNLNLNVYNTNKIDVLRFVNDSKGSIVMGKESHIKHSNNLNINTNLGNLQLYNVSNSKFNLNGTNAEVTQLNYCNLELYNGNNFKASGVNNSNFNLRNVDGYSSLSQLNNVRFMDRFQTSIVTNIDNCYNCYITAETVNGLIENVYNTSINTAYINNFRMWRVGNCEITGFPITADYVENCRFNVTIPQAIFRNSSLISWETCWPHTTDISAGFTPVYNTKAGLAGELSGCYITNNNGSLVYDGTQTWTNSNNMQGDYKAYYAKVNATLPIYNMAIRLNIDCNVLTLNMQQAGPPHGFADSSISANKIQASGIAYQAQLFANLGVRCYSDYTSASWYTGCDVGNTNQPVIIANNARPYYFGSFAGGLICYKSFNMQNTANIPTLQLRNGACMFINNARFINVFVNNAMLYLGTNVIIYGTINVTNGGYVCNKANVSEGQFASKIFRNVWCWNVYDKGPWGNQSLIDYCRNV